jgi:pre-mRNA-splicing factor 18
MEDLEVLLSKEIEKHELKVKEVLKNSRDEENSDGKSHLYIKRKELESHQQRLYLEKQRKLEEERELKKRQKVLEKGVTKGAVPRVNSEVTLKDDKNHKVNDVEKTAQEEKGQKNSLEIRELHSPLSSEEVMERLRQLGEPIRLFGETDEKRMERLKKLELVHLKKKENGSNLTYDASDKPISSKNTEEELERQVLSQTPIYASMLQSKDMGFICKLIRIYLKDLLTEWKIELEQRSEQVKFSAQGKLATSTQHQTHDYIQPLFDMLSNETIPIDILQHVTMICELMQQREYIKANDIYYLLSIGNAPWPIGVTMVGIHERSAREKIFSSQVAHVLNDERQRKWIQSLKRIMTFTQKRFPPDDLSKMA